MTDRRPARPFGQRPARVAWRAALLVALVPGIAFADTPLARALAEMATPVPLPRLELVFADDELASLLAHRDQIRDKPTLVPDDRRWVGAVLVHDGRRLPAKVRIRGDLPVHWRGDRISYRVKLTRELYRGMKEINFILPKDKHYAVELLQTRIAEDLGLLFFPSRFVRLVVNGASQGLYLENEHPTREYLERMGRTPSSIFTFAAWWTVYYAKPSYHVAFQREGGRDLPPLKGIAQIKQRATFVRNNPVLARKQLAYALEFYRLVNDRSPADVGARAGRYLDLDNFARYVAIQDFFGSLHAMELSDNVRLYLDPSSGKLEFMPWDTSLRSLRRRIRAGVPWAELLRPRDEAFRVLIEAVPGLDDERRRVLRGLLERGPDYRDLLATTHARLIHLFPDDHDLREEAERIDRGLGRNLDTLEEYFERERAGKTAPGMR
jgi:hypothetical protein